MIFLSQLMKQITLLNKIAIPSLPSQFRKLLRQNPQIQYTETTISSSTHFRSLKQGFQVQFSNQKLNAVFIYFRTAKFTQYKGNLPYDITSKSTIRSIVMFLGQPTQKSKHAIEIIYEHLGLGIVFQNGNTWGKEDALIDYLYYFPAQTKNFCASCLQKQPMFFQCKKCSRIMYCSQKCMDKHYGNHLVFCQQVQ